VLGPLERARKFTDTPVKILASEVSCDTMALQHRRDITTLDSTVVAAKRAFARARKVSSDVQVLELDDAYTISALMSLEALGFAKKTDSGRRFAAGEFGPGGKTVVNTSGGLKAQGRPFGAVGVAQVVEIVRQLRGQAGDRQVPGASVGLAHVLGGTGATSVVHLLERAS